jgi:hypothetical protein
MPLVAWLEDEVARAGLDDFVAELCAHAALEDVAELVLSRVEMKRRGERARRHRVLNQGEPLVGLDPIDHEADANAAEEADLSVLHGNYLRACRRGFHL